MQIKLLKDIVASLVGASSIKIVDLLYDKKNVNEFLIAKSLHLTINQTRNILYKLADGGLVSFIRKKDKKKGGWYIYFWTLNSGKSMLKFKEKLTKEIGELQQQLNIKKTKQFFYCSNCNIDYTDEVALLNNYACPECGEISVLKDNTSAVAEIEKQISKLNAVLLDVDKEIGEIMVKENIVRNRKFKVEAKKKENERMIRKKEKARLLKKEGKGKKPAKKVEKKNKKKGKKSKGKKSKR